MPSTTDALSTCCRGSRSRSRRRRPEYRLRPPETGDHPDGPPAGMGRGGWRICRSHRASLTPRWVDARLKPCRECRMPSRVGPYPGSARRTRSHRSWCLLVPNTARARYMTGSDALVDGGSVNHQGRTALSTVMTDLCDTDQSPDRRRRSGSHRRQCPVFVNRSLWLIGDTNPGGSQYDTGSGRLAVRLDRWRRSSPHGHGPRSCGRPR